MINTMRDEYISDSHLDSFDHDNTFHDKKRLDKIQNLYNISKPFKLVLAKSHIAIPLGPGLGFIFIIPLLLANVRVNPF